MTNTQQKEKPNFLYYTDWAEQLLSFPADLRLKIDDAVKNDTYYTAKSRPIEMFCTLCSDLCGLK